MKTQSDGVLGKVAAQNIRLLIERQKSGKPLTRAQLQQVENYFSGKEEKPRTWAKSLAELGGIFGVTRMACKKWIARGAPQANASGFYPIEDWKEWVAAHGAGASDDEDDLDKSRLTARQVHLRNQLLELQIQQARGEVMHRDEIRKKLYQTFDTCKRLQLRIGPSLAGRLSGMTPTQISNEITTAIRNSYAEIQRWADEQAATEAGTDPSSRSDTVREEREEARPRAGRKDRRKHS
jgi:hypothetical protein